MKKLLILLLLLIGCKVEGQRLYMAPCPNHTWAEAYPIKSPKDSNSYYFLFDSLSGNNIWQIGIPQKKVFNTGYLNNLAIVTDTLRPYPTNNHSSFQFAVVNCINNLINEYGTAVSFTYKMDSDSGADGGTIEISRDRGKNWINLVQDTMSSFGVSPYGIYSKKDTVKSLGKPGFSGFFNWRTDDIYLSSSTRHYSDHRKADTTFFRFTFGSDSVQTNKDGWIIGALYIEPLIESIENFSYSNLVRLFPNPATDKITLESTLPDKRLTGEVMIYDAMGREVLRVPQLLSAEVDVSPLPKGMYVLKYADKDGQAVERFVKLTEP